MVYHPLGDYWLIHKKWKITIAVSAKGKQCILSFSRKNLMKKLCKCLWAFRVFFVWLLGFGVFLLWNLFWTLDVGNSVFSLQSRETVKRFGGELCKTKPQGLCLVDAVLFALQHYRKNYVNDIGEWMGWESWQQQQQQQGLCQTAELCTALGCEPKKSTSDFSWFTCILVVVGESRSKLLT